jgi:uncharacterized protein
MGSGVGGMLMTGAAAAAGAYLGNRMASGHDSPGSNLNSIDTPPHNYDAGAAGAAGGGFPALDGSAGGQETAPDYFADDNSADNSSTDYFSSDDNSSYDDTSSGDSGGGGFDGGDNSGSW